MWWTLIQQYWQVCLFSRTPDDTPHSGFLLATVIFFFLAVLLLQWEWVEQSAQFTFPSTLAAAFSLVISYGLYTFFLLKALKLSNRVLQTLTCLYICHLIVHLFAFPLIFAMPLVDAKSMAQSPPVLFIMVYLLIALGLTIWQFLLSVFIYKKALSTGYFSAVLASCGLLAANMLLVSFWR